MVYEYATAPISGQQQQVAALAEFSLSGAFQWVQTAAYSLNNVHYSGEWNAITVSGTNIVVAGYGQDASGKCAELAAYGSGTSGSAIWTKATDSTGGHAAAWNAATLSYTSGYIMAAGFGADANGTSYASVAEFNSSGNLVSSFGSGGIVTQYIGNRAEWNAITQSNGYTFVTGYGTTASGNQKVAVTEYNSSGQAVNPGFGLQTPTIGTSAQANAISLVTNGSGVLTGILLAGSTEYNYVNANMNGPQQMEFLAEYNLNGTLDTAFGAGGIVIPPLGGATSCAYGVSILNTTTIVEVGQITPVNTPSILVSELTVGPQSTTVYGYDVRNKMVSFSNGSTNATYVYDDAGNRVEETTGGTASFYLTDTNNPTGYAQPIEVRNSVGGVPVMTYILGDRVLAQASSSTAISYLLVDGHGNTRLLTNASGSVTASLNYDAFGDALNFNASSPPTIFLYPDGPIDPVSGLRMAGDGTRDEEIADGIFIERDFGKEGMGNKSNPVTLNAVIYGDGDPANNDDPSGHYDEADVLISAAIYGSEAAESLGTVAEGAEEGAAEANVFEQYNIELEGAEDETDAQLEGCGSEGNCFLAGTQVLVIGPDTLEATASDLMGWNHLQLFGGTILIAGVVIGLYLNVRPKGYKNVTQDISLPPIEDLPIEADALEPLWDPLREGTWFHPLTGKPRAQSHHTPAPTNLQPHSVLPPPT